MDCKRAILGLVCLVLAAVGGAAKAPGDVSLEGQWEITSLIENGESIAPVQVRAILSADGRVAISGNTVTFMQAGTGKKRTLAFVVDSSQTPYQIDLAGTKTGASRGIFTIDRDLALVCLGSETDRPTNFVCTPGSGTMLLSLKRVPNEPSYSPPPPGGPQGGQNPGSPGGDLGIHTPPTNLRPPVSPTLPPTVAVPLPLPLPPAPNRPSDSEMKARLVGTWGFQDERKVATTTFNSDGTFSALYQWKSSFRKVFSEDLRASGSWNIEGGVLIVRVNAATEREFMGQIYSVKISTLSDGRLIGTDSEGKLHMEWRIR